MTADFFYGADSLCGCSHMTLPPPCSTLQCLSPCPAKPAKNPTTVSPLSRKTNEPGKAMNGGGLEVWLCKATCHIQHIHTYSILLSHTLRRACFSFHTVHTVTCSLRVLNSVRLPDDWMLDSLHRLRCNSELCFLSYSTMITFWQYVKLLVTNMNQ